MKRLAALGALPLALASVPDVGAELPCRFELSVEPEAPFVEQAVEWRLRIESRTEVHTIEWLESPAFPNARAERVTILPGAPSAAGWSVRREDRVIFPERAGEWLIPFAVLACESSDARHELHIPGRLLTVQELPAEGRPEDFSGLVGPAALRRAAEPTTLALGAASHVTVTVRGSGNLWAVRDDLGSIHVEGAESFGRPPETRIERGGGLRVIRLFEIDVVPRRSGTLTLPPLRLSWFDPETRRYTESVAAPIELYVAERPVETPRAAVPEPPRPDEEVAPTLPGLWLWTALKSALVLGAAVWLARRLWKRRASE